MKQWFTGTFRGHYRGIPSEPSALSPFPGAPHFRIEVYEAIVSNIELGPLVVDPPAKGQAERSESADAPPPADPAPAPSSSAPLAAHHTPSGSALHQTHIGKVHLVDPVRVGQTLRSTAHDVLMSAISLSHPAEFSRGTLGHIEGVISGWYRPPPAPPEVEEVPALEGPPPVGWRTEVLEREEPRDSKPPSDARSPASPAPRSTRTSSRKKGGDEHASSKTLLDDEVESEEELDQVLSQESESTEYPFFALGAVITLLLAFFATPLPATIFGLTFLLSYGVRRWLLGVLPDVAGVRVFSLVVGSAQILVAALLIARWEAVGCVSLSPLPLIWLLGAQMAASLLPRPLPFALTTLGFAAVLLQAYASWAPPHCPSASSASPMTESEPPIDTETPIEAAPTEP